MARARKTRLTDVGVARLKPAASEYTIWDMRVPGLGVRVRPSGHRGYVYQCKVDGRAKRVTLGPAALKTVAEVRRECLEIEVTKKSGDRAMSARGKTPTFATFVAGSWKSACFDRYKPATRKSVRGSLRTQLLPAFGDLPLDRIDRMRVHRWFDEYSRTAPGGANHALDTFRRIMNHAIALGHAETNPTRDVKPNPRAALTRFLSLEGLCCKLGEGAMRDQGASCSPYDSALARRSCSHAMASVRAHGPRPKARSTIRASPTMPPWRANIPAWPLRSARITSKPLIVA